VEEEPEPVYLLNQCHQWQLQHLVMFPDSTSSFQSSQYHAQQYNTVLQNQPPFPNWTQQPFPSSSPWLNETRQSNWPNFPYDPTYWQKNAYRTPWSPPTSQSQAWQEN